MTPYIHITLDDIRTYAPSCAVRFITFKQRNTLVAPGSIDADLGIQLEGDFGQQATNPLGGILYTGNVEKALETNEVIADSDILSCQVTKSKGQASGTFELTLAPSVDYHALIHTGDYVFIWMKRSPIMDFTNSYTSGLKCWGVVTSVRRHRQVNADGSKSTTYTITGSDWGHLLEQDVYINQILGQNLQDNTGALSIFLGHEIHKEWGSPSDNVNALLQAYVGSTIRDFILPSAGGAAATQNGKFQLPSAISSFFAGANDTSRLASLMQRQMGVFTHYVEGLSAPDEVMSMPGFKIIDVQLGSAISLWSLLQAYSNPIVNEMFTELKTDADGHLIPTVVLRQIPFTSDNAKVNPPFARFSDLPRVALDESCINSEDIGRSETDRHNVIQVFGTGSVDGGAWQDTVSLQTFLGNWAIDPLSILRYGTKVFLQSSDSDLNLRLDLTNSSNLNPEEQNTFLQRKPGVDAVTLVPDWIKLYADWYLQAHLLESGTFHTFGIEEPVNIGDNLEIRRNNGNVELYHIQSYTHMYQVASANGSKVFRTSFAVTRGQMEDGSPIYASTKQQDEYPVTSG